MMSLFKKPDITGWSYSVVVNKDNSVIRITDPDGNRWGHSARFGTYKATSKFDNSYFYCRSITEKGIDKYAKRMIRKCLRLYTQEKRRDALRAENFNKEF
jgi:hypothetical protein